MKCKSKLERNAKKSSHESIKKQFVNANHNVRLEVWSQAHKEWCKGGPSKRLFATLVCLQAKGLCSAQNIFFIYYGGPFGGNLVCEGFSAPFLRPLLWRFDWAALVLSWCSRMATWSSGWASHVRSDAWVLVASCSVRILLVGCVVLCVNAVCVII